jgi:hypothetical protein
MGDRWVLARTKSRQAPDATHVLDAESRSSRRRTLWYAYTHVCEASYRLGEYLTFAHVLATLWVLFSYTNLSCVVITLCYTTYGVGQCHPYGGATLT